jgi:hypothetical protein
MPPMFGICAPDSAQRQRRPQPSTLCILSPRYTMRAERDLRARDFGSSQIRNRLRAPSCTAAIDLRSNVNGLSSCVPCCAILRGNRLLTGMRLTHEQRLCSPPSPWPAPSSAAVVRARVFAFPSTNTNYHARLPYAWHTHPVKRPSSVLIAAPHSLRGASARNRRPVRRRVHVFALA